LPSRPGEPRLLPSCCMLSFKLCFSAIMKPRFFSALLGPLPSPHTSTAPVAWLLGLSAGQRWVLLPFTGQLVVGSAAAACSCSSAGAAPLSLQETVAREPGLVGLLGLRKQSLLLALLRGLPVTGTAKLPARLRGLSQPLACRNKLKLSACLLSCCPDPDGVYASCDPRVSVLRGCGVEGFCAGGFCVLLQSLSLSSLSLPSSTGGSSAGQLDPKVPLTVRLRIKPDHHKHAAVAEAAAATVWHIVTCSCMLRHFTVRLRSRYDQHQHAAVAPPPAPAAA
jgi:hypothetical protein